MAVRQDNVQISISFITDESKAYAKLLESNKTFIKDLKTAQKNGQDVSDTLNKIAASGKQVENLDLNQLTPSQLVSRARQLKDILAFIPSTNPAYAALSGEFKKINDVLATLNARTRGVAAGLTESGNAFTKFVAGAVQVFGGLSLDRILGSIAEFGARLFKLGPQIDAVGNKAETVFGETFPQVSVAAKENAQAMGLTTTEYTKAAAAIGDLLIPMQFTRQESTDLSLQLVDLSGALAEWEAGQYSAADVSKILSKAILGEREELKSLGIAINEEDVKNRVREKGLDKLNGVYLQQARAIATVELILEKSTDAQDAFIKNNESITRRQAELTARLKTVIENFAVVLLPIFESLIDFADGFVDILEDVAEGFEAILDPAKAASDAYEEQAVKVKNLEKTLPPLLDRYEELTGKSKLTKDEQTELSDIIQKIGEVTPGAITEIDKYGKVLSISATASREFLKEQKALLLLENEDAIKKNERALNATLKARDELVRVINAGERVKNTGVGTIVSALSPKEISDAQKRIEQLSTRILGLQTKLKDLRGEERESLKQAPEQPVEPPTDPSERLSNAPLDPEEIKKQAKEREKARKEALDLELKAVEVAIARKQVVVESDRLNNLISESDYQKRLLQLQEEEYTQQLEVYRRFGAEQTLQALELRKKLIQVQQDLQPRERIDLEALPGRATDTNVNSQTAARQRGEDDIDTRFGIQERALRDSFRRALILEEEYNLMSLQLERSKIEAKLALLANATGEELKQKTQLEKDKAAIEEQIADEQAASAERRRQAELEGIRATAEATTDLFGLAAELLAEDEKNRRKNASAIKAFQSAQIILNGILEVQRIWASAAELGPIAGPIYGVVATGVAAGRSALALAKVQNTKLARGKKLDFGVFGGKPHSAGGTKGYFEDGTQVEVEKDEAFVVVNKRSTSMLRALSSWNQAGGGVPFFGQGGALYMQGGGLTGINTTPNSSAASATSSQINLAPLMAQVDRLVRAIEQPRNLKASVVLTEFEAAQNEYDDIVNDASL